MSRWIKATTPPDSGRDVLALEDDGVAVIAFYEGDGEERTWYDARSQNAIVVSYWMPIPKRPKGYEDDSQSNNSLEQSSGTTARSPNSTAANTPGG